MMPRDNTPGKGGFSSTKQSKNAQQPLLGNILNSEERKMLFNTFMKEMNQSLLIQSSNSQLNKKPKKVMKDSIKHLRTAQP